MTPERMMARLCPEDHCYKVALYPDVVELDSYTEDGEWVGVGYDAGGAALTGYRVEVEDGEAVLRFINVEWMNADIKVRTVLIYDADTLDAINITHLERTAGVYAGFFEYKMPDEGVCRLS